MEEPTNIFYKIYEIMNHYENILDNSSYDGSDKYTEGDDFFNFLFKNMKKDETKANPDEKPAENTPKKENEDEPVKDEDDKEPDDETTSLINAYIKKCYKKIVLKCHPDKNKSNKNAERLFIKCHDYYDNLFLIGLLYVFYLYKLLPPAPLNNTTPSKPDDISAILIERIFKEIRLIQDKLIRLEQNAKSHEKS